MGFGSRRIFCLLRLCTTTQWNIFPCCSRLFKGIFPSLFSNLFSSPKRNPFLERDIRAFHARTQQRARVWERSLFLFSFSPFVPAWCAFIIRGWEEEFKSKKIDELERKNLKARKDVDADAPTALALARKEAQTKRDDVVRDKICTQERRDEEEKLSRCSSSFVALLSYIGHLGVVFSILFVNKDDGDVAVEDATNDHPKKKSRNG